MHSGKRKCGVGEKKTGGAGKESGWKKKTEGVERKHGGGKNRKWRPVGKENGGRVDKENRKKEHRNNEQYGEFLYSLTPTK